jgi:hypothetical protein
MLTGLLLVGVVFMFKWLDATPYGGLIKTIIGEDTAYLAHSLARGIIALLTGLYAAWLTQHLGDNIGEQRVDALGATLAGILINLVYKKLKP